MELDQTHPIVVDRGKWFYPGGFHPRITAMASRATPSEIDAKWAATEGPPRPVETGTRRRLRHSLSTGEYIDPPAVTTTRTTGGPRTAKQARRAEIDLRQAEADEVDELAAILEGMQPEVDKLGPQATKSFDSFREALKRRQSSGRSLVTRDVAKGLQNVVLQLGSSTKGLDGTAGGLLDDRRPAIQYSPSASPAEVLSFDRREWNHFIRNHIGIPHEHIKTTHETDRWHEVERGVQLFNSDQAWIPDQRAKTTVEKVRDLLGRRDDPRGVLASYRAMRNEIDQMSAAFGSLARHTGADTQRSAHGLTHNLTLALTDRFETAARRPGWSIPERNRASIALEQCIDGVFSAYGALVDQVPDLEVEFTTGIDSLTTGLEVGLAQGQSLSQSA